VRVLFAGSPEIAVPALSELAEMEGEGVSLAGILTNTDSRRGRKGGLVPTDVSAAGNALDARRAARGLPPIPQIKAERLRTGEREAVAALKPDLLLSFASGFIFGPRFLSLFPLGALNIHPSLLPRYRGASPIPAVILSGDRETGISIQSIAAEIDSGDLFFQESFPLTGCETTASLSEAVARRVAEILPGFLLDFAAGTLRARPQEGEASYSRLIKKGDGRIDWGKRASEIARMTRAFNPWPLTWTTLDGKRLSLLEADAVCGASDAASSVSPEGGVVFAADKTRGILITTGDGLLRVTRLQLEGKKPLFWKDFLNGLRNFEQARLV
jgi:methionyl-tRNA formyltransferase